MLSPDHLQREVVTPALKAINLWSLAAERLVLGTAIVESRLTYLRQIKGPALGLWQVEPATHRDVWVNWLNFRTDIAGAILDHAMVTKPAAHKIPPDDLLVFNLRYAAMICRCLFRRVPAPLPDPHDWPALGRYWKLWYNTHLGKGSAEKFVSECVAAGVASA